MKDNCTIGSHEGKVVLAVGSYGNNVGLPLGHTRAEVSAVD